MDNKILKFIEKEDTSNIRFFKSKNDDMFFLINQPSFEEKEDNYNIINVYNEQLEKKGQVQYSIIRNRTYNTAFLYNIFVNEECLGKSIGFYALKFFEEVVSNKFCSSVEGKYYPKAPAKPEEVKKFYLRNGYSIEYEGYDKMIYKYLSKENLHSIKNNTKSVNNYKIYGKINEFDLNSELTN
ncbi:MAG: hypothetical protein PHP83_00070 [Clostridia bacterium]|nr:hypothetical protein [Clostridia bacterium]